jgi:hypothetical protein
MSTNTREELITIAEKAIVPQKEWGDRDSEQAHKQLGIALVFLKAGCRFEVDKVEDETIWGTVHPHGFRSFEYSDNEEEQELFSEKYSFYLPTISRLIETEGKDWY